MSEELDFELIDDNADEQETIEVDANEDTTPSDDESKESSEDNTPSAKSKKSNFKKLSKINKALIVENKRMKAEMSKMSKKKTKTEDEFEDLEDDDTEIFDRTEFRFFLIENPEAKPFSADIENIINNNPTLDIEDALALAKARKPAESTSSDDFSTKSVNTKIRKKLGDLTEEEAQKLPNDKYLEYQRAKGKVRK